MVCKTLNYAYCSLALGDNLWARLQKATEMFDSNVKWHSLGRFDTRFIACPRNHRRPVVAAAGAAAAVAAKSNPETMPHSSSKSRINEVVVVADAVDALTPTSTSAARSAAGWASESSSASASRATSRATLTLTLTLTLRYSCAYFAH